MTQKDYIALAAALKSVKPPSNADAYAQQQWRDCAMAVIDVCAKDNEAFHRGKFLKALGIPNIGVK